MKSLIKWVSDLTKPVPVFKAAVDPTPPKSRFPEEHEFQTERHYVMLRLTEDTRGHAPDYQLMVRMEEKGASTIYEIFLHLPELTAVDTLVAVLKAGALPPPKIQDGAITTKKINIQDFSIEGIKVGIPVSTIDGKLHR